MFAPVLQSQAKIRIPIIEETKEKIEKFLLNLILDFDVWFVIFFYNELKILELFYNLLLL